jgi:hypothetical protein
MGGFIQGRDIYLFHRMRCCFNVNAGVPSMRWKVKKNWLSRASKQVLIMGESIVFRRYCVMTGK